MIQHVWLAPLVIVISSSKAMVYLTFYLTPPSLPPSLPLSSLPSLPPSLPPSLFSSLPSSLLAPSLFCMIAFVWLAPLVIVISLLEATVTYLSCSLSCLPHSSPTPLSFCSLLPPSLFFFLPLCCMIAPVCLATLVMVTSSHKPMTHLVYFTFSS